MRISAHLSNSRDRHEIRLQTNDNVHSLHIAPKPTGFGSSVNGGELLFLALATCFCNDLYREAARRGIEVEQVEVEVEGEFGREGEPARTISYRPHVRANASADEIRALIEHTDRVLEIQNTVRAGVAVKLVLG